MCVCYSAFQTFRQSTHSKRNRDILICARIQRGCM